MQTPRLRSIAEIDRDLASVRAEAARLAVAPMGNRRGPKVAYRENELLYERGDVLKAMIRDLKVLFVMAWILTVVMMLVLAAFVIARIA